MTRWIDTLEASAAERLPRPVHDYYRQGAEANRARDEATPAWDALRLRPRVLRDVSSVTTATTVLGTPVDTPVLAGPTALQHAADPAGETATARGTADSGSLVCVSASTAQPYSAVRDTGSPWWAQVYVVGDRALTGDLVARAAAAGASALVVTVDTPVVGRRPYPPPGPPADTAWYGGMRVPAAALRNARNLTFDDIGWLRGVSGLPVVVKGVLRPDDALSAIRGGAEAVVVSNHGGRQLDTALPTARALPAVAEALSGSGAEIYVDGGVRGGLHTLTALALGARAVLLGRPVLWALSVSGSGGVARLLLTITAELRHAMTLAGARTTAELTPDLIADDRFERVRAMTVQSGRGS